MVDQLTNVERSPQRRMRSEQAGIRAKNSAYTKLKSELDSLKSLSKGLKDTDFFDTRKVTSSESHITASATAGTSSGDYNFEIYQLATSAKQLGASDVGGSVSTSSAMSSTGFSIPVTAGTVTVQGKQVTVSTDDSLAKPTTPDPPGPTLPPSQGSREMVSGRTSKENGSLRRP